MSLGFVLPTLFAAALIAAMVGFEWKLRPRLAIPLLTAAMALAAVATATVVLATSVGFLLGPARSSAIAEWCRSIPLHHRVGPVTGVVSLMLTALLGRRVARIVFARRRVLRATRHSPRIDVVQTAARFAYAVPNRRGSVVVSTGLLEPLSPIERKAVFAHERAHLRLGHHRYLLIAELSQAVLPFLGPLVRQVRHATERAADEAAAAAIAGRRDVVASAIARAVLGSGPSGAMALAGGSVSRRVEALLWPEREPRAGRVTVAVAVTMGLGAGVGLLVQLHHFSDLLAHLCHSTA